MSGKTSISIWKYAFVAAAIIFTTALLFEITQKPPPAKIRCKPYLSARFQAREQINLQNYEYSRALAPDAPKVVVLDIDGMITAGTAAYLTDRINKIGEEKTRAGKAQAKNAVIIRINTPGGLVDATLDILRTFSASPVPVVTFVAPSGSIAASAGSFLLVGSHVAAMAPGTTVGAAMPVEINPAGGQRRAADEKTISFLAGHMKSIAAQKGRPPEIAAAFVTDNLTLNTDMAVKSGVVDLIAADLPSLLKKLDGRKVKLQKETVTLKTAGAVVMELPMTTVEKLQNKVSNPQVAFLLLLAGAAALFFGLSAPGTVVLETLGAILLVLGIYGMGLFSTNTAGIAFIVLGLGLITAEIFTPTFGVLGMGGVISLVLGALLLPQEPLLPNKWYHIFRGTVLGGVSVLALVLLTVVAAVIRSRRSRNLKRIPKEGKVIEELNPEGLVKVEGELWRAKSKSPVSQNTTVIVTGRKGLTLLVEPKKESDEDALEKMNVEKE